MRLRYVLLSLIGLVAVGAETTCIGPAFPFIMKEFKITLGTLGLLASAWNLGYLFVVLGGLLSDRYGEPLVLSLSLALSGVSAVFISTVSSYELLLIFFFFGGLGGAFGDAAIIPLVARLYPARSGFALNILYASFCGGAFLGPILAGCLIVRYESWRPPYLLFAFIFLPLMAVWIIQALKLRKVGKPPVMPHAIVMGQRNFVLLIMMMASLFFYHCAELGSNAWLPSFLIFEKAFPTILASLPLSLFWIFMALGRIILGYISDRGGFKRIILSCSVLGGFLILVATEASNRIVILALWSLSGFVFGPMFPTLMAWISRLFPTRRGFASGSAYSIGTLGAVFSPWFIGAIAESYTLGIAILFLVFSTFAIGLSTLRLDEVAIKT